MVSAISLLEKSALTADGNGVLSRDYYPFAEAMSVLFEIRRSLARGEEVDSHELLSFRTRVVQLLSRNEDNLWTYVSFSLDSALSSASYGWYAPSFNRSCIQFLLDDYPGVRASFSEEDCDNIIEMDEYMWERGPLAEAIPVDHIPAWVPASHWWWRHASWMPGV